VHSSTMVSAFEFDVALSVLRRLAPAPADPTELRVLALNVLDGLCPHKPFPDDLIDALVVAAGRASYSSMRRRVAR